jgi:hypothetical protein
MPLQNVTALLANSVTVQLQSARPSPEAVRSYALVVGGVSQESSPLAGARVASGLIPFSSVQLAVEVCYVEPETCFTSSTIGLFTLEASPEGVLPPNTTALSSSSIQLQWRPPTLPNGILLGYQLQRSSEGGSMVTIPLSAATVSYIDRNLAAATDYAYVLVAINSAGSTASTARTARTLESLPGGQGAPLITAVFSTAALVTWQLPSAPNGQLLRFTLLLIQPPAAQAQPVFSGTDTFASLTGLIPDTNYQVAVRFENSVGSVTSTFVAFKTGEDGGLALRDTAEYKQGWLCEGGRGQMWAGVDAASVGGEWEGEADMWLPLHVASLGLDPPPSDCDSSSRRGRALRPGALCYKHPGVVLASSASQRRPNAIQRHRARHRGLSG